MANPERPQWIFYPYPRLLKLRLSRGAAGDRVVAFDSGPFLIELDQTRLPKGVRCVSSDPAKQHYTFRVDDGRPYTIGFSVYAPKAENTTGLLSGSVEGDGLDRDVFVRRIDVYNLDTLWNPKLVFLALDILREFPNRWKYPVAAVAAVFLLVIAPPWYWTSLREVGIRVGVLQDFTRERFYDDFEHGLETDGTAPANVLTLIKATTS
jgi:hypothetical protein